MALTDEDRQDIAKMMAAALSAATPAAAASAEPEPEPPPAEFWVHLADGRVLETHDSASTHIDGVAVIGRYAMGA